MVRRFRFPLQTLLKVRRLREREAQRKVAAQSAGIARLDRLDQATRAEIAAQQDALRRAQQRACIRGRDAYTTLDPRELSRGWAWIAHLQNTLAQRQVLRASMLQELERLRAEFREARRQTRTIEKLRERRWADYVRDRRRREQAASDEVARQLHLLAGETPALPLAAAPADPEHGRASRPWHPAPADAVPAATRARRPHHPVQG